MKRSIGKPIKQQKWTKERKKEETFANYERVYNELLEKQMAKEYEHKNGMLQYSKMYICVFTEWDTKEE